MSTERAYFSSTIESFLLASPDAILGEVARRSGFAIELPQRDAWQSQIDILREQLTPWSGHGHLLFEFVVPRMGRRIDVLMIINHAIFVIEFKVGDSKFNRSAFDQVWDYALDLKNFHEPSSGITIAPILIATKARGDFSNVAETHHNDGVLAPIKVPPESLRACIHLVLSRGKGPSIDPLLWVTGRYKPTPSIIEAASALYSQHSVANLAHNDAGKKNLAVTSLAVDQLIEQAKLEQRKIICFVTGVPGAGKTLVGLNVATKHMDAKSELHSVYLSGNGPLVKVLCEALARDEFSRKRAAGERVSKGETRQAVKLFIQNVHHFRDTYLNDQRAPIDHVVIFDEAQRAWTKEKTTQFMASKKGRANFDRSEPDFLISCMDRHKDWAVVVCLVGGGQEINSGEAGISEWLDAIQHLYPKWEIHISPQLTDSEYAAGFAIEELKSRSNAHFNEDLHLAVSMRSFRAEHVSTFVKHLLDRDVLQAKASLATVHQRYPIVITRDLPQAKQWLKSQARGTERYGIVASSQAERLKPHAINVKSPMDPVHWFLDGKEDLRSSYYLEDVATEFHVQGLELDWACVVWDADLRSGPNNWRHHKFKGSKWENIKKTERQIYLKNAYRVLLTRARQGMVIVVPNGDQDDPTRDASLYDPIYEYLLDLGLSAI